MLHARPWLRGFFAEPESAGRGTEVATALLVVLLGVMVVFGAGLAQAGWIHDAAHDTRHNLSFPCH